MIKNDIPPGKYRHYKTRQLYEVIAHALHTETHEELVIYKALYTSAMFDQGQIWARPKKIFLETVNYNGNMVPRFSPIK